MPIIDDSNNLRLRLIEAMRRTLIGPNLGGPYVEHYRAHHQDLMLQVDDEILLQGIHDSPGNAYKSGKLEPQPKLCEPINEVPELPEEEPEAAPEQRSFDVKLRKTGAKDDTTTDEPISQGNEHRLQSSMGLTFRVRKGASLKVVYRAAMYVKQGTELPRYRSNNGQLEPMLDNEGNQRRTTEWWKREAFTAEWMPELKSLEQKTVLLEDRAIDNGGPPTRFHITRRRDIGEDWILTLVVINTGTETLFQNELSVHSSQGDIRPYETQVHPGSDKDRKLMDLLYRNHAIYAIGHGCSVAWNKGADGRVQELHTDFLPVHSLPPVAPNKVKGLDLAMYPMSRASDWDIVHIQLKRLIDEYGKWIDGIVQNAANLDNQAHMESAHENIAECRDALARMKAGVELLVADELARRCFRHMNEAMLWQQQRSKVEQRKWNRNGTLAPLDETAANGQGRFTSLQGFHEAGKGRWRPFQLAFVLMNLSQIWDPTKIDRGIVDLIWFPTGGGKTEAYLGLTAFTIFRRRLLNDDPHKSGTTILMRYTLRLLTTQQFERAASLILACNEISRLSMLQGGDISIGLWVGSANTPNNNQAARDAFNRIGANNYSFILRKCPCCGAEMGPTAAGVKGLRIAGNTEVRFRCANIDCEYHNRALPIYVVDEQIYDHTPTLVIGTVDKFAGIPWNSQESPANGGNERMSRLFGFRDEGRQLTRIKPPDLIIQDELHLIAGPLGSMVGMYETLLKELCTDHGRYEHPFIPAEINRGTPPKIVASSATITRAADQVQALYGTDRLQIFPPQGLEIGETWFSTVDDTRCPTAGHLHKHGRWYVGMCPDGSALTPMYRGYATVLQELWEAMNSGGYEGSAIDYYRTLVCYFNSIRELSRAKTLLGDNVPDYLNRLKLRRNLTEDERRSIDRAEELTSRVDNDEIPAILKKLEQGSTEAVDVCMATNMIATGLDVSRLALMFIQGQPKTTAEYIQASSRVGRETGKGPGLVILQYNQSKPRDRSIFEHFRAYHEKLYSHVEPTSVTPFSIRVRERALHAIFFGLIRHYSRHMRSGINHQQEQYAGLFTPMVDYVRAILMYRAHGLLAMHQLDQRDIDDMNASLDRWVEKLIAIGDVGRYGDQGNTFLENNYWMDAIVRQTLMMSTTKPVPELDEPRAYCLPTPTSMRQVDGVAALRILAN
jgi:hypothetical protein